MLLMSQDGEKKKNTFRCQGVSRVGSGRLLVLPQAGCFGRLLQRPSSPRAFISPVSSRMTEPFSLCCLHALVLIRISTTSPTRGSA